MIRPACLHQSWCCVAQARCPPRWSWRCAQRWNLDLHPLAPGHSTRSATSETVAFENLQTPDSLSSECLTDPLNHPDKGDMPLVERFSTSQDIHCARSSPTLSQRLRRARPGRQLQRDAEGRMLAIFSDPTTQHGHSNNLLFRSRHPAPSVNHAGGCPFAKMSSFSRRHHGACAGLPSDCLHMAALLDLSMPSTDAMAKFGQNQVWPKPSLVNTKFGHTNIFGQIDQNLF